MASGVKRQKLFGNSFVKAICRGSEPFLAFSKTLRGSIGFHGSLLGVLSKGLSSCSPTPAGKNQAAPRYPRAHPPEASNAPQSVDICVSTIARDAALVHK